MVASDEDKRNHFLAYARSFLGPLGAEAGDGDAGGVGRGGEALAVEDQGRAGLERERRDAAGLEILERVEPDDGQVEAEVLPRLGDLDDDERGLASLRARELGRALDAGVGPSIPSTATIAPPWATTVWPMSKPATALAARQPSADVGRAGPSSGERVSGPSGTRRWSRYVADETNSMPSFANSATIALAGSCRCACPEPMRTLRRAQVGQHAAEQRDVLDLPRHDDLGHAGVLEGLDRLVDLAELELTQTAGDEPSSDGSVTPGMPSATTGTPRRRASSATRSGNRPEPAMSPSGSVKCGQAADRAIGEEVQLPHFVRQLPPRSPSRRRPGAGCRACRTIR